jgi:hypothetical protein
MCSVYRHVSDGTHVIFYCSLIYHVRTPVSYFIQTCPVAMILRAFSIY